jgi:hypothetical protein
MLLTASRGWNLEVKASPLQDGWRPSPQRVDPVRIEPPKLGSLELPSALSLAEGSATCIDVRQCFRTKATLASLRKIFADCHIQPGAAAKAGVKDSADQIFADWTRHDTADARYSDRDRVRVFADENVPTFNFLIGNGVELNERPIGPDAAWLM